jgi:hypothetical protein
MNAEGRAEAAARARALLIEGKARRPLSRAEVQADPDGAVRRLARSRALGRLRRTYAAEGGSLKGLKRRARAHERAGVHRASSRCRASSSGLDESRLGELRSGDDHFGRSAAQVAREEAAEIAALNHTRVGPPKRGRESTTQKARRHFRYRSRRQRARLAALEQEGAETGLGGSTE